MREFNGVWWDFNQKQVPGILKITDENKIVLVTYEKLNDTGLINGFAECKKITLVGAMLDRTDVYHKPEEDNGTIISEEIKYYTYTYVVQMVILGNNYERKGDIRLKSLQLKYTNLEEWVNWESEMPLVKSIEPDVIVQFKNFPEKRVDLEKFDLVIRKPYFLVQKKYEMQLHNEISIFVENIKNSYIDSLQEIIDCIQFFLVLCIGDNINVTQINAIDFFDENIELILGYGKSNYENRSILKNIIKYEDIKDNLETILKNWIELYIDNELLIAHFVNLQRREDFLISEYTNMISAIENLFLVTIKQSQTKVSFVEIMKKLLMETNFILNLSENEINEIAVKVKEIRRYFVHSNKMQKDMVNSNISFIKSIMTFLIEVIRVRIMLEIGIDKEPIEKFYKSIEPLQGLKLDIVHEINEDEKKEEGDNILEALSKKDRENIAKLNAMMGTRYREVEYDLSNTKDLIEAVEYITAEYMDYTAYWADLSYIVENFDQSLEVFKPQNWIRISKEHSTGNDLIDETIISLGKAEDNMFELKCIAEEKCKEIWKILLLGDDKEAKEYFVGENVKYEEEKVNEAIEAVIENIFDIRHRNVVEEDCENFAKKIKEYLQKENEVEE